MAQLYFFMSLACTECVLLAAMAYDALQFPVSGLGRVWPQGSSFKATPFRSHALSEPRSLRARIEFGKT